MCHPSGKTKIKIASSAGALIASVQGDKAVMAGSDDDTGLPPSLADLVARAGRQAPERPVERWNPARSGTIDMRIGAGGAWLYRGTPIAREALVRLFASILRREDDGSYVLVTPVEKLSLHVDDAPFSAVELAAEGEGANQILTFRTNVGDIVRADSDHPLRFAIERETGGLKPYVRVRGGLDALLTRALALDLIELAGEHDGKTGVWSGGAFFALPDETGGTES